MKYFLMVGAAALLVACSEAANVETAAKDGMTAVAGEVEKAAHNMKKPMIDVDLSSLPAGTYTSEAGHAYIQFSYDHQGYSRPVLRWRDFEATVDWNPDTPEGSTLNVTIPVAGIDSMVPAFDDHLKGEDFFDMATYPTITFESTDVEIHPGGHGIVTGDLTIKDITRPISFEGTINKVGKNFRSGVDMFGISGTGQLKRSDFGVGKYAPNVGDDVELVMEVEFQKVAE